MPNKTKLARVVGDVAYIPLTQGYEAIVDAKSLPIVQNINWYALRRGRVVYAVSKVPKDGRRECVMMHRLLAGAPSGMETDHINSNGLDNRIVNLRVVTVAQNRKNVRCHADNKSGYKGVSFCSMTGKWIASIMSEGKAFHLGRFSDKESAHSAYVNASNKLHGAYGRAA